MTPAEFGDLSRRVRGQREFSKKTQGERLPGKLAAELRARGGGGGRERAKLQLDPGHLGAVLSSKDCILWHGGR